MMGAIRFQSVSKIFQRHTGPKLMRHHFRDWFRPDPESDFYALKDISFAIEDGESVAIVGRNGAGKSTLLSLVSGLSRPERGRVEVTGQLAALLELGSGFHGDLTGRENIYMNASILGFSRKEIEGLETYCKGVGAKGLVSLKIDEHGKPAGPSANRMSGCSSIRRPSSTYRWASVRIGKCARFARPECATVARLRAPERPV